MADGGEIVFAEIFLNKEAVHRRRCAECRDLILREQRQDIVGVEAVEVVDKCCSAVHPLSVQLAPESLAPAGVGDCQMKSFCMYTLPVAGGDKVAEGVFAAVNDRLRISRSSGREQHQHLVIALDGLACAAVAAGIHLVFIVK